jgi:hypothetical protein
MLFNTDNHACMICRLISYGVFFFGMLLQRAKWWKLKKDVAKTFKERVLK